ncbi:hypothetical protein PI125_g20565 [Phytophthora idaei]|nr:hypothetical protein PI125_g20565 [Phytophthora idaei]
MERAVVERAMFFLKLDLIPSGVWTLTEQLCPLTTPGEPDQLSRCVMMVFEHCWSLGAELNLHRVWRWRTSHLDVHDDVSERQHAAIFGARLRAGYETVRLRSSGGIEATYTGTTVQVAARVLLHTLTLTATRGRCEHQESYILFFDGVSSGNPGPGGSGIVIARLGDDV